MIAKTLPELFVEKLYVDIDSSSVTIKRYLALNTGSSVNAGTLWFGVTAETGSSWFYAVGAFKMACGGYAVKTASDTTIYYRIFIYDRCNWDVEVGQDKETVFPTNPLSYFLDDDKMDAMQDLRLPNGQQPYFRRNAGGYDGKTESYVVNDALMGALVESGDADKFDITGAGVVHWVRLRKAPQSQPNTAPVRSEGTVR